MRIPEWVPVLGKASKAKAPVFSEDKADIARRAKLVETLKSQKAGLSTEEYKTPPSHQDLWDNSRGEVMSSKKPEERTMTNDELAAALPKVDSENTVTSSPAPAKTPDKAA